MRSSCAPTDPRQPDPPGRQADDKKVGYPFIAYPVHVMEPLVREGKLISRDESVVIVLISFANQFRDSCWCLPETVSGKLGCRLRTVQSSLARLSKHGVISHRKVAPRGEPDPLQPDNRTGWRWVFLWNQTLRYPTEEPDRRPPMERKQPRFKESPGQMHLFASDQMQSVASERMQSVASKTRREVKTDSNLSQNTTTTACDGATRPPAREAAARPAPSSSSFQERRRKPESFASGDARVEPPAADPELAELVKQAAARFPEVATQSDLAAADVCRYGPDRYRLGLEYVSIRDDSPDPVDTYRFLRTWLENKQNWPLESIQAENQSYRRRWKPKRPTTTVEVNRNPGPANEPPPPPTDPDALRRDVAELEAKEAAGTLTEVERRWLLPRFRRELKAIAAGLAAEPEPGT